MGLSEHWVILRRRKRLVIGCVVGCVVLSAALNELTTPIYRSTLRVEVQREPSRSPLTGAVTENPTPQSDNQALFTAAQIITSRPLMAEVVADLERGGTFVGPKLPADGRSPTDNLSRKIDWLMARVAVEPLRDTRLIRISAEHSQPRAAAAIANAVAQNFVRFHSGQRSMVDTTRTSYLKAQAEDLKNKIKTLEGKTHDSERFGLFSLEGKVRQLSETIRELNDSYSKATTERLTLSSQLDRIRSVSSTGKVSPSEIPIHSGTLDALRRDLLVSSTALAKARETYGASHPKIAALRSENEEIRRNLREEVINAVSHLENQRSMLVGREASLRSAIAQAEAEMRSRNDQAQKYSTIEGELKSNRELYSLLVARVREAEITGDLARPLVRIIESASTEPRAVRPRKPLNLAIGLLLGVLSSTGLALLLDSLRRTIRTPQDVDHALQLPVLGLIPKDSLR